MANNTEEEQIEILKDWWDRHGKSILVAILLSVGGVLGYQSWQKNAQETGEAASLIYQDLVEASAGAAEEIAQQKAEDTKDGSDEGSDENDESSANNPDAEAASDAEATADTEAAADTEADAEAAADAETKAEESPLLTTARNLAQTLKTDYTDTTYAVFAALHLAKLAVDGDDYQAAMSELEWALEQDLDAGMEGIVRARLARVLRQQDQPEAALARLNFPLNNNAQRAAFAEIRGDIYHQMGAQQQARDAYQAAIDYLSESEAANSSMIETKLAAIPIFDINLDGGQEEQQEADQEEHQEEQQDTIEDAVESDEDKSPTQDASLDPGDDP